MELTGLGSETSSQVGWALPPNAFSDNTSIYTIGKVGPATDAGTCLREITVA